MIFLPRISIPVTLAYVNYLVFSPLLGPLVKLTKNKNLSVILLFIAFILSFIIPLLIVFPSINDQIQNLQYYIPRIESLAQQKFIEIRNFITLKTGYSMPESSLNEAIIYIGSFSSKVLKSVPAFLANALEWMFLVPLFYFFMLKDGNKIIKVVLKITPNKLFERFYNIAHQLNVKVGGYIFAKIVEATIVGSIIAIGCMLLNLKFPIILGFVAGITNIIPYLGPLLGAVPGILIAYYEFGFDSQFGFVLMLYLLANVVDMVLVFPLLVSKIVDLHPLLVIVSVIIGSQLMGFVGMIISIPLTVALKLIIIEIYKEIYSPQ